MSTTTYNQTISTSYSGKISKTSVFSNFIAWCAKQEHQRLLWLAIIIAVHGCVLTPLTGIAVVYSGNNIFLFGAAIYAMAMCLIVNLAAMPTKITIPFFFLSVLIDVMILTVCLLINLNIIDKF